MTNRIRVYFGRFGGVRGKERDCAGGLRVHDEGETGQVGFSRRENLVADVERGYVLVVLLV